MTVLCPIVACPGPNVAGMNTSQGTRLKRAAAVAGVSGALLAGTATMAAAEPATAGHADTSHQKTQTAAHGKTTGGFAVTAKRKKDSSAGHSWVRLTFTNKTKHTIHTTGWAGVAFVGHHDGTQLGKSADRLSAGSRHARNVRPGKSVHETVRVADPSTVTHGSKHVTTSDGFRVYAPNSKAAVYVPYHTKAATKTPHQSQLGVRPIH